MLTNRLRLSPAATLLAAATILTGVTAGPALAAAPGPPGNPRVTAISPSSVTLAWTPANGDVASYSVNYHLAFNDVFSSQPAGTATTATITSTISPASQYTFSITAKDSAGVTSSSGSITVVTPRNTTGDVTPPSAPGTPVITSVTANGPELSWSPATDDVGVAGYEIYFFNGWFGPVSVGSTTGPGTTFVAPFKSSEISGNGYFVRARDAAANLSIATAVVPPPTVTTPPPPARTCRVAYRTTSEWSGGFVAEVTITNLATTAVNGWTVTFPVGGDQRITSAWEASVKQSGADVTLTAARWNQTLAPGGSVTVGLLGRWTTSDAPPTSAALNGAPCALA